MDEEQEDFVNEVNFQKFTAYGNNFVIVDEIHGTQLREDEKSRFACQATNVNFGVGADAVLFLQPCRNDVLAEINDLRGYWDKLPAFPQVDLMFRIFEPNGTESFSCGNGLMCLASFLSRQYNIASTRILTQIPTRQPKVITIGTNSQKNQNWANMGPPIRIPQDIVHLSNMTSLDDDIDIINDITITFRARDLHPFSDATSLDLIGFLVYTGEPHLVIFPKSGFSINELKNVLFVSSHQATLSNEPKERRIMFGSWLIHHIGMYLNARCMQIFPKGINVDFVDIPVDSNALEYRCFERGINKETLACGTGALAASFVAQRLNLINAKQITVWPHRSRWYEPEACILVDKNKDCWSLRGKPVKLLEGNFLLEKPLSERIAAVQAEDQNCQIQEENAYHLASINF